MPQEINQEIAQHLFSSLKKNKKTGNTHNMASKAEEHQSETSK